MSTKSADVPVLVAGGGIGGLAAALALTRQGFAVKVLEQAPQLGEIGAGIQLGPNAFAAFDALGIGEKARGRAVYTDEMVMHDALDETLVGRIPTGEAFRQRFGNPYAVIHRADVHMSLLEGAQESDRIEVLTSTTVQRVDQDDEGVTVHDTTGGKHRGIALIGADGVKSAVRRQYVGDDARVSGHVVYRAVVDKKDFPKDLQWNAASIWVGPNCHLVHYPLRGGEQYNVVVTFHSREQEEWSVREGSREEVQSYFEGICARARQLIDLPKSWKRWATADREPIGQWTYGRATLLGDAAHPTLQYLAQGACMALEDGVTLGEALRVHGGDFGRAFAHYERSRIARTARIVLSAREMGRIFHAKGVERLVRNELWKDRTPERFYDAMEWLYGWRVENCLAAMMPPTTFPCTGDNTMQELGRLEDLPRITAQQLTRLNLVPLWPNLRAVLPPAKPVPKTRATHWSYETLRPLLLKAGELTPIEKAERRVLVLANPGHGLENMQASAAIYLGMQLLLPGEWAPAHRHTPNAVRMVVEGEGAWTTVNGEKCPMSRGDLILTPTGLWHEHGHDGATPVVWLDVLDLPLVYYMEASYHIDGERQAVKPGRGDRAYARGGVVPTVLVPASRTKPTRCCATPGRKRVPHSRHWPPTNRTWRRCRSPTSIPRPAVTHRTSLAITR